MKKKVFFILACIWLIISFLFITSTYAKYLSALNASTNVAVASWKILLNNQDILSNSDFTQNLNLTFPETEYKIADVIVPGAVGYFDINIDCSNVSLYFTYHVTCTLPVDNKIDDVKIIGYVRNISDTNITPINSSTNSIDIPVLPNATSNNIRVFVQWVDDQTEVLDDEDDTTLAQQEAEAKLQVNVSFEQTH